MIADGEDLYNTTKFDAMYIALPLAAGYHQRACRSWARGNLEAALADVYEATFRDYSGPYHATSAVLLDALNRRAEARVASELALHHFANPELPSEKNVKGLSRAYFTRGVIA